VLPFTGRKKATKVNAGLAESNGRLLLGIWRDSLHVTCGLTAFTPGSAPGPTIGNEYGKTLPLPSRHGPQCRKLSAAARWHFFLFSIALVHWLLTDLFRIYTRSV